MLDYAIISLCMQAHIKVVHDNSPRGIFSIAIDAEIDSKSKIFSSVEGQSMPTENFATKVQLTFW